MQIARSHVLVCGGTGCLSSNSDKLRERLTDKLKELGISDEVQIIQTGCFGLCAEGPIVVVYPEGAMYAKVTRRTSMLSPRNISSKEGLWNVFSSEMEQNL